MDWDELKLDLVIAYRSLKSVKVRTLLAMSGVFLGTFSLVVVTSLCRSLAVKTQQQITSLGKNLLVVQSGLVHSLGGRTWIIRSATTLTLDDARAVAQRINFVMEVAPSSRKAFPVHSRGVYLSQVTVLGTSANYAAMHGFVVQRGTFFTAKDVRQKARVAVLGWKVARKLFPEAQALDRVFWVGSVPVRVIGVLRPMGSDLSGFDQDNLVLIPLSTFLKRLLNKTYLSSISVGVTSPRAMEFVKRDVTELLRRRHAIRKGYRDDFTVIDSRDVMAVKSRTVRMIQILGTIAASVSFLIGGIGILSVMVLVVQQRRLEIGLRRALGSTRRDILFQFFLESSFISLAGGMVGIILGVAVASGLFVFLHYPKVFSFWGLVSSLPLSFWVGLLAGIDPARRALAIQPADVIR